MRFVSCNYVFDMVPKNPSEINEGFGTQFLVSFVLMVNIFASLIGMGCCHLSVKILVRSLFVLQCRGNISIWIPKLIWPELGSGLFRVFC